MSRGEWEFAGKRLRELRKEKGKTIYQVGNDIDVSGNFISMLERGIKKPTSAMLDLLADYYAIDKNMLMDLYDDVAISQLDYLLENRPIRRAVVDMITDPNLSEEDYEEIARHLDFVVKHIKESK